MDPHLFEMMNPSICCQRCVDNSTRQTKNEGSYVAAQTEGAALEFHDHFRSRFQTTFPLSRRDLSTDPRLQGSKVR